MRRATIERSITAAIVALAVGCTAPPDGPNYYRCVGENLECLEHDPWDGSCTTVGPVPCVFNFCSTSGSAAQSYCESQCAYSATSELVETDGCAADFGSTSEAILGRTPQFAIVGTADPALSTIEYNYNQTGWVESTIIGGTISVIDTGGEGSPGLFTVTNLELRGADTIVDTTYLQAPAIIGAQTMFGSKMVSGSSEDFEIDPATVVTNNYATIDDNTRAVLGSPAGGPLEGWIDYDDGELWLSGYNYSEGDGFEIEATFTIRFVFAPAERPVSRITRTRVNPSSTSLDGTLSDPGQSPATIQDYVWYRGNRAVEHGYLNAADVLGYGETIVVADAALDGEETVTLYIVTTEGAYAVATVCYLPEDDDYECLD
jgi:hypothetical protein